MHLTQTESGLLVATDRQPQPEPSPPGEPKIRDGFPVKAGWCCNKCGERYRQSRDEQFRMRALEDLYTAVDPGGGGIVTASDVDAAQKERLTLLLNELAVALVGGVPEGCEEYT